MALTNAILLSQRIATKNGCYNNKNGKNTGCHANTDTLDDDCGGPGNTSLSDRLGRPKAVRSIVLGSLPDQNTSNESNGDASKQFPTFLGVVAEELGDDNGTETQDKD